MHICCFVVYSRYCESSSVLTFIPVCRYRLHFLPLAYIGMLYSCQSKLARLIFVCCSYSTLCFCHICHQLVSTLYVLLPMLYSWFVWNLCTSFSWSSDLFNLLYAVRSSFCVCYLSALCPIWYLDSFVVLVIFAVSMHASRLRLLSLVLFVWLWC